MSKASKSYRLLKVTIVLLITFILTGQGYLGFISIGDVSSGLFAFDNSSIVFAGGNYDATCISLTPGKNASEVNWSWYTPVSLTSCAVQIAKKLTDNDLEVFPVGRSVSFGGEIGNASTGFSYNKVTVKNLEESTEYVYRLGNGSTSWSQVYTYTTRATDQYGFFFVGDPQIGVGGNSATQAASWANTIEEAVTSFPEASFMVCAGDQVNDGDNDEQYSYFFSPEHLKSLPIAVVRGNHDWDNRHIYHFNLPNQSTISNHDYYFTYGNTLFMFIYSNDYIYQMDNGNYQRADEIVLEHGAFLENTVAAHADNEDIKWRVVMFHHSIYSAGGHFQDPEVLALREWMVPYMDELDIDVVLMGHDHLYVRSHQMLGDQPQLYQYYNEDGSVQNPTGTLYITGNAASNCKFYNPKSSSSAYSYYTALTEQRHVPYFSYINVTDDTLEISTYETGEMTKVDNYKIVKPEPGGFGSDGISVITDNVSGQIIVQGNNDFLGGDQITLLIQDSNENIKYIGQTKRRDNDGYFLFKYNDCTTSDLYTLKVGSQNRKCYETEFYISTEQTDISIEEILITNSFDVEVTQELVPFETINIDVKLFNNTNNTIYPCLMAVLYNSDDECEKMNIQVSDPLGGRTLGHAKLSLQLDEIDGHYIKIYTWTDIMELMPLAKINSFFNN